MLYQACNWTSKANFTVWHFLPLHKPRSLSTPASGLTLYFEIVSMSGLDIIFFLFYLLLKIITVGNNKSGGVANGFQSSQKPEALELLFAAMPEKEEALTDILNAALVYAAWFGEYQTVKYLIQKGADSSYKDKQNRSILELSKNAVNRFADDRVYQYILSLS